MKRKLNARHNLCDAVKKSVTRGDPDLGCSILSLLHALDSISILSACETSVGVDNQCWIVNRKTHPWRGLLSDKTSVSCQHNLQSHSVPEGFFFFIALDLVWTLTENKPNPNSMQVVCQRFLYPLNKRKNFAIPDWWGKDRETNHQTLLVKMQWSRSQTFCVDWEQLVIVLLTRPWELQNDTDVRATSPCGPPICWLWRWDGDRFADMDHCSVQHESLLVQTVLLSPQYVTISKECCDGKQWPFAAI